MDTYIGHMLPWSLYQTHDEVRVLGIARTDAYFAKIGATTKDAQSKIDLTKVDLAREVPNETNALLASLLELQTFDPLQETMGVVNDAEFIFCFWNMFAPPNQPVKMFADGSSGLRVWGASKNVTFPDDTVFVDYYPDAASVAAAAVLRVYNMRVMKNLTADQAALWKSEYDLAVKALIEEANSNGWPQREDYDGRPTYHTLASSQPTGYFLRQKSDDQVYIAALSNDEAIEIASGKVDVDEKKAEAVFVPVDSSLSDADAYYQIVDGNVIEATAELALNIEAADMVRR